MKFKALPLLGLILAAFCSFTFDAKGHKRADQAFKLDFGKSNLDPTGYSPGTVIGCPGDGKVCYIIVPDSDIYTAAEVASLGLPTSYIGKPKVDDFNTGGLGAQIQAALIAPGEVSTPVNGRTIIERY
uniref:hypothetical protein n=1 Tax=Pedobacter schmidteae TaxID=2201271 RepID=UPI000EAEFAA8|nr:hypothetical protein [Pedobacter schmidteae]